MLLTKTIKLTIRGSYKHYEDLGYEIPYHIDKKGRKSRQGEEIVIKVEDLPKHSRMDVLVRCDYCGDKFYKPYNRFIKGRKTIDKDCCNKCKNEKIKDVNIKLYGSNSITVINKINNIKGGRHKIPFSVILELFKERNLELLYDEEYYNENCTTTTKLLCKCKKHNDKDIYISYDVLKYRKYSCEYCKKEIMDKLRPQNKDNIRKTKKYKIWREQVFKKDNYICQCCGYKNGGNLQAHHICNFSQHEELRYDIDNGITLCEKCHNPSEINSFHYLYGTKKNTLEQIICYINNYGTKEMKEKINKKNNILDDKNIPNIPLERVAVRNKRVEVFKDEVSLGMFPSTKQLSLKSLKLFGIELKVKMIRMCARGEREYYEGFRFKYIDD